MEAGGTATRASGAGTLLASRPYTLGPVVADIVKHGLSAWWAPALAFAAGVISFASPCVYPLVPGYVSFVSGAQREEERPVVPILLFILGFAVVFTLLGATAGHLRTWILSTTGQRVA